MDKIIQGLISNRVFPPRNEDDDEDMDNFGFGDSEPIEEENEMDVAFLQGEVSLSLHPSLLPDAHFLTLPFRVLRTKRRASSGVVALPLI